MARNNSNRGGNRGGRNNNPEGHNQYDRGWIDSARERPFTAAAAVGGAVAAGVFLWSKRNQISDQIAGLSDQISDWREGLGQPSDTTTEDSFMARPARRGATKSQSDIAEEAMTLKETGKKSQRPSDSTMGTQTQPSTVS